MKKLQIIVFVLIAVMMLTALPMAVSAASDLINIQYTHIIAPDGVEQGAPNNVIIMSFEGKEKFEENSMFKTFGNNEHGIYEFVTLEDGTDCLKLGYNKNIYWANFRTMPTFKEAGFITTDFKYATITYMTKDTAPAAIRLTNNADHDDNAVFTADASVSKGEWIVSDLTFIGGGNMVKRYSNGSAQHCTIEYTAESPESALYIKELAFFKSEEDAKKYYNKDTEPEPEPSPDIDTKLPPPVIMSFEGNENFSKNSMFKTFGNNEHGVYEFVTLADGTQCLKLGYNQNIYWANYRVMPTFKNVDTVYNAYKYVRITYMTEDDFPASIRLTNNADHGDSAILVPDASISNGKWKRSNAVFAAEGDIIKRFSRGEALHCTIEYTSEVASSALYIKELAFFATEEQAYSYYNDTKQDEISNVYSVMSFGENGNASVNDSSAAFGTNSLNEKTNAIDIVHGQGNFFGIKYMAKLRFNQKNCINNGENYVRVLYSAQNPEGTTGASLFMLNDGDKELIELVKNVPNTNGEFILSDTVYFPGNIINRLTNSALHVSFCSNAKNPGGTYSIKAVFFFPSRASADAFDIADSNTVNLTIDGNDISNYRIVIPTESDRFVIAAADMIVEKVKAACGIELPVVTDDTAASPYEIILGHCSRPEAETYLKKAEASGDNVRYEFGVTNGKLIINAVEHLAVRDGAQMLAEKYIYASGFTSVDIDITEKYNHSANGKVLVTNNVWSDAKNIDDPYILTDDFSEDKKYFTEDYGKDNAKIENGVLTLTAKESSTAYIHVYESNVRFDARMKYTDANVGGELGLTLRYNAADAYVRGGWDKDSEEWFIEFREGTDFGKRRIASKKSALAADTWYDVAMTSNGSNITLEVNGETVLSTDEVDHVTPGRVGIFAENASVVLDDIKVTLLSGEGTVIRGVEHTLLPDEELREGGTVLEMNDGTLHYETHYNNAAFKSIDGGKTWNRTDSYFKVSTYPQILRLNNGDLLNIVLTKVDGVEVRLARLSSDDGKTWRDGGVVCPHVYNGVRSLNMNDKVTQSATTGRIFYSQNYDGNWTVNGTALKVFCAFFYSDDNGLTWHESETGSWEIPGNEKEIRFGESKIIQCADGTLRLYNSWNAYPCIVYSESTDNGVTWGPIQKMPSFVCTTSSMQIVRDPYADNDTTYYMVWVNCDVLRSRLSLARTEDGKTWSYIGDIWRWECAYKLGQTGFPMAHIVDPFISVSRDKIITGAGIPEHVPETGPVESGHGELRQHIFTIDRDTLGNGKATNVFMDIDMGAPYYEAVSYVSKIGLFTGVTTTQFAPDTLVNRAMFVTVLGRLNGADMSAYTKPTFKDVAADQWYTTYVEWAAANSIVNGIGNGLYGTFDNVTVQQACVILARYANFKASDTPTGITLADYPDSGDVAAWAKAEMEWALANGIYDGINGVLAPNAPASRALAATMFYNYTKNIK